MNLLEELTKRQKNGEVKIVRGKLNNELGFSWDGLNLCFGFAC